MLSKILKLLGVRSYVKIRGKGFSELTSAEAGLMIDAFPHGESAYFEQNALYEFMLMSYKDSSLNALRNKLCSIHEENRTPESVLAIRAGRRQLMLLSNELRGGEVSSRDADV